MADPLQQRLTTAVADRYQVGDEIGRGGMSVVYRAQDLRLNRPVAIKVLPPELAHDPAVRTRFIREAQTSALLSHGHIVPIYDVGERESVAYFVMAFVNGGSLAALLAEEPRQPIDEVRRLLCEIADALSYAHTRGVIHRDIKPDNILIHRDSGLAMVTDFGIARAVEAGTRLTVTGIAVGTPTYMSPEQAVGEREIDGRSDIYSLGVVAYQMLTGRVPFEASNSMALLMKHVSERPRPVAELRPDAPKMLRDAIERALLKAPADRWPSAAAMRDALVADAPLSAGWRGERREGMRYSSPRPDGARRDRTPRSSHAPHAPHTPAPPTAAAVSPRDGTPPQEPAHLASLTPEQRTDLRLWGGRVTLLDRVKVMRVYAWATAGAVVAGFGAVFGAPDVPPLALAPAVPIYMSIKAWRRGQSLRAAGLRLRRVLFLPRAKWVLQSRPAKTRTDYKLGKVAPREILDSPYATTIRRAVEAKDAILDIVSKLPKADRALLPDITPTVKGLVDRVVHLAQSVHRLDQSVDPAAAGELDARIAEVEGDPEAPDADRRLALLRRQRATLQALADRRALLTRQLENAGLALGALRLDLLKFRSSGLESALSEVSTATQEARALSNEIGAALEAAAEMKNV